MNEATLEQGKILLKTIEVTKESLSTLKRVKIEKQGEHNKRQADNKYDDGLYSLHIGEYSDLSGDSVDLVRYGGNMELLDVIIETLGNQLDTYETEFESL